MSRSGRVPLLLLDVLGASTLAACLLTVAWLTLFHSDHAVGELRDLQQTINSAAQDLSSLRAAADRQRATLKERQAELATHGQLPAQVPVEEYFQNLSRLVAQHRLRVVRHNPLTPRSYPGLLEQRFAYEVMGTMPDLARFFRAIEEADFWADVSYLKIDGGPRQADAPTDERVASLTISIFSAPRADGGSGSG
jgi:Tfp pilus assembly protein PilO